MIGWIDTNPHLMAVLVLFVMGWDTVDKDITLSNAYVGQQIRIPTVSAVVVVICIIDLKSNSSK